MIELNEKIEKEIQKLNQKESSFIDYIFNNPNFKRSSQFGSTISDFKETIVFENAGLKNYLLFIIVFVTLIFGLTSIEDSFNLVYFLISSLLGIIVFYYYKKRKKIFIKINEFGIEIQSLIYKWEDIYDYGFLITPKRNYESYSLFIFLNNETKFSFELNEFNNPEEIIETMNFFRNKFISNS